jgi:hypothetical protein
MGCFCHRAVAPLSAKLSLMVSLSASVGAPSVSPKQLIAEELAAAIARWLAAHGLPAEPWQPDPAWLSAPPLPRPRLSLTALATLASLAQLRAQVLAQLGLDLLVPAQAAAFARIVATLAARLPLLPPVVPPAALVKLAAQAEAVAQVTAALEAGLLAPPPPLLQALNAPACLPMQAWREFLRALRALLPLIALSRQLGLPLDPSFPAALAPMLRVLRSIALPSLPPAELSAMAALSATLSAVARLQAMFGLDPVAEFAQVQAMATARLAAMVRLLPPALSPLMRAPNPLALLESLLPKVPFCPTQLAPPPVVMCALSASPPAIEALDWQVPEIAQIPILRVGPLACALVAQVQATVSFNPVLPAPCGSGCDAARIAAAIAA